MRMSLLHPTDCRRVLLLLSACCVCALPSAFAQDKGKQGASTAASGNPNHLPTFAFDVVSIRPHNPDDSIKHFGVPLGGDEFQSIGMPLGVAIEFAYLPLRTQRKEQIVNAPAWLWSDEFDFVGKVGPDDLEEWRMSTQHGLYRPSPMLEAMLQAALADRCKLAVHRVPATFPGFALVVSSRGPNRKRLAEAKPDETIPDNAQKMYEDGKMVPILSSDDPVTHFYETSMVSLAAVLSSWGAPVEDQTGLTGKYDFALTRLSTIGDPSVDWDVAALGLKLKPIKIQTENIVIDHIERPSPN